MCVKIDDDIISLYSKHFKTLNQSSAQYRLRTSLDALHQVRYRCASGKTAEFRMTLSMIMHDIDKNPHDVRLFDFAHNFF